MIRPYEDRDVDDVLRVWASASRVGHPFLSEAFLRAEREAIAIEHLPYADTWVYETDGGEVVGFIALVGSEIGGLFVDATNQRRGIGHALVAFARAREKELSLKGPRKPLEVEVFARNTVGLAFYRREGFKPFARSVHEAAGEKTVWLSLGAGAAPAQ